MPTGQATAGSPQGWTVVVQPSRMPNGLWPQGGRRDACTTKRAKSRDIRLKAVQRALGRELGGTPASAPWKTGLPAAMLLGQI